MTNDNYSEELTKRQERAAQREAEVKEIFHDAPGLWDWRRGDPADVERSETGR